MLGHNPFYYSSLRKVTSIFGTLFNEIGVVRKDKLGNEVERFKVPIAYGPKEKYLTRMHQDPDLNRPIAIQVPRMSFQIVSIQYDGDRKRNKIRQHVQVEDDDNLQRLFDGVPYKIGMELTIISKNQDDANQILEQILPFFTPDFSPSYNPIPGFDWKEDLPVVLNSVVYSDNYDDDWKVRRNVLYTLTFELKAFFYGPIKEQGVIKKAITDIHIASGDGPVTDEQVANSPRSVRITIEPDPLDADADDDYGYTETLEEFNDGKKRDPVTGTDIDIP